ncbi:ExbD/TolR family protein [Woodsholea maritima]|uniref:ExbD/TolR family protein n=1 Tax=Woodsholea maritima TaxID=240237 RepID=UPI00037F8EF0|nr:biopolymer transporter ExbD [Woodsholea maritima]
MSRRSRVNTESTDAELDMTPMLDVVFILLIFFIVTSVFVKEPGTEIFRPEAALTEGQKPSMLVAVTSADEIWVNRNVYELSQLRGVFEQMRQENPLAKAMIQGDAEAPIGTVLDVQELLMDMGIDVHVSTQEP